MNDLNILIAFGGGVLAFISPCVLPMVPVYLATLAGPEFLEHTSSVTTQVRLSLLKHSVAFIAGFSVVFTGLGFVAGVSGSFISPESLIIRYFSGSLLVLFGAYMLAAIRFPQLNLEKRLHFNTNHQGIFRSFLTGAIFTLAWTPCVTPVLGSILTLAINGTDISYATGLLAIFSLGMGIPLLLIAFFAGTAIPYIRRIRRFSVWIHSIAGLILVATGLLILTGNLNTLIA